MLIVPGNSKKYQDECCIIIHKAKQLASIHVLLNL